MHPKWFQRIQGVTLQHILIPQVPSDARGLCCLAPKTWQYPWVMIWNVARMGGIQLDWTILYLEISDVSDVLGETMSSHTNFFCSDSTPRVTRVATRVAPEHVLRARAETSRTYIPSSWPCIQEAAAGRKDSRISPFLSKDSKRLKSWLRNASKCYIFTWLDVNWMLKVETCSKHWDAVRFSPTLASNYVPPKM